MLSAVVGCGGADTSADSTSSSELVATDSAELGSKEGPQLARLRAVTARYHDVANALADGFFSPDGECTTSPGAPYAPPGGMGIHYINPARMNLPPDPDSPSILLYEPHGSELKLVGVEFFMPAFLVGGPPWFDPNSPPPGPVVPAPTLFGHTFDGPMPGHTPGMPWHYDLHVWIWRENPNGMFLPFNTRVSCGG